MGHAGTSWEGTKWRARALPREALGPRLGGVARRLSRPLALCLFLAAFPALALSVLVFDPTPASSGSCSAYTTINNSVRSRTEARCNNPLENHLHYVFTELRANTNSQGWRILDGAGKTRGKPRFSVESRRMYVGCGRYLGYGLVRGQDQDFSRTRHYCR